MEEEREWENELADNIRTFCATSSGATAIVVDGTSVRKRNVLIIGNRDFMNGSTSTEIYDSTINSIRKGPEMKIARCYHALATLPSGDVAVYGGYSDKINPARLSSCEVLDVQSNSFSEIGNMIEKRQRPAAVLLRNDLVLIIGGYDGSKFLNSCEFYNPSDKKFYPSKAKISVARAGHTASLLPNGKVRVCGGYDGTDTLQTTEIYDPSTDSFSAGPLMTVKRCGHAATVLEDGSVLVTGGENDDSSISTEIYDPASNSFSAGPKMVVERYCHFSALLPDGRVLIGGGEAIESKQTTEIYDPKTNSFSKGLNLLEEISYASAVLF